MKQIIFRVFTAIFLTMTGCSEHITESADTVFDNGSGVQSIQAKFSSIQDSVFTPLCASGNCHGGAVRPQLTAGDAYSQIVNIPNSQKPGLDRIEPGNPAGSYLLLKISGENILGTRMPLGLPPISQPVIDSIRVWIENGALPD